MRKGKKKKRYFAPGQQHRTFGEMTFAAVQLLFPGPQDVVEKSDKEGNSVKLVAMVDLVRAGPIEKGNESYLSVTDVTLRLSRKPLATRTRGRGIRPGRGALCRLRGPSWRATPCSGC